MAAVVLFSGSPDSGAQTGSSQCQHRYTAREYRKVAQRIYHQPHRIGPRQLYKLLHLRVCAVDDQARAAMNKTTLNQRSWRIARRARAERECGTPTCNRRLGRYLTVRRYGIDGWRCTYPIIDQESGWDATIRYGGAHGYIEGPAYGIPQAKPGSKMASAGPGWQTDATTQIRWFFSYVDDRYGGPCGALEHKRATNWY